MAENSFFWTTSGSPSGHQVASYTQAHWSTAAEIMAACAGFEGVAPGYKNELAVTYISANHCHVNSGGAVVDGKVYINDAPELGVTIDSATAGHYRIDRIVALCDWAAYTVTIAVKKNTVEDTVAPALDAGTEDWTVSGTHYAILLYQASVTDAGVVTLTDERNMASPIKHRQGGSATDWGTQGSTNYPAAGMKIQTGVKNVTILTSAYTEYETVTFPEAFSYTPVILLTVKSVSGTISSVTDLMVYGSALAADSCVINAKRTQNPATELSVDVAWLAIGPE